MGLDLLQPLQTQTIMASKSPSKSYGTAVPLSPGAVSIVTTAVCITILASVCTGLRFYSRRLKKMRILAEDYTIAGALVRVKSQLRRI